MTEVAQEKAKIKAQYEFIIATNSAKHVQNLSNPKIEKISELENQLKPAMDYVTKGLDYVEKLQKIEDGSTLTEEEEKDQIGRAHV